MVDFPLHSIQYGSLFGKVVCESNWKWNTWQRPIQDYDLWYVWDGEGEVNLNGKTHSVSKGCCFLFRPGDRTIGKHNPAKPLTVTFIHFYMDSGIEQLPLSFQFVEDRFIFENYLNQYVQSLLTRRSAYKEEATALLKLLLLHLWREPLLKQETYEVSHKDQMNHSTILEIANYIRQSPGKQHLLDDLAGRALLSPRYFSLKFKQVVGKTVESFIIESRIERAEQLLRFNGMNVTEVAEALGYKNIYFFSRQFKKYRGISPSQARKR